MIETREVTRLGSVRPHRIDVRFIAATNRDLEAEVARGAFRADLYYRLNGITLTIPPLRSRLEEIRPLAETFVRQICRDLGRQPPLLPRAERRPPGGLRLAGQHPRAQERHRARGAAVRGPDPGARSTCRWSAPLDREPEADRRRGGGRRRSERDRIVEALAACAGNQSRAAKMLGIPRRTFVSKLDAYRIPRPKKRRSDVA